MFPRFFTSVRGFWSDMLFYRISSAYKGVAVYPGGVSRRVRDLCLADAVYNVFLGYWREIRDHEARVMLLAASKKGAA